MASPGAFRGMPDVTAAFWRRPFASAARIHRESAAVQIRMDSWAQARRFSARFSGQGKRRRCRLIGGQSRLRQRVYCRVASPALRIPRSRPQLPASRDEDCVRRKPVPRAEQQIDNKQCDRPGCGDVKKCPHLIFVLSWSRRVTVWPHHLFQYSSFRVRARSIKSDIPATETTPLSGKKTWSSALSGSIRTCAHSQRICSRSVISRLRLRGNSASKSRLPGPIR
jgi:hypothetical protein